MKGKPPASAQTRVAYAIGRLDRALRQSMGQVTAQEGLTVAQYTALSVLQARGPLSNAQLARRTFVTPQAMNELAKALVGKRLIGRGADPDHQRIVRLRLTAKGEGVLERCRGGIERVESRMLQPMSAGERGRLRLLIDLCIAQLEGAQSDVPGGERDVPGQQVDPMRLATVPRTRSLFRS